jgi:hypothetical protein
MSAQKPIEVTIDIDEQTAQGVYINMALISHTDTEFIIDFIYVQPQQPKGRVRARVISSPLHTKRLLQALQENIHRYEQTYGEIKTVPSERKIVVS